MNANGATREQLLERFGRFYGDQHFAVAFTQAIVGDPEAKRCLTRGWETTTPLADGNYAAGLIANRGKQRNPVVVLRPSNLIGIECDTEEDLLRIDQLGLPETVTVRTSADYKRHFWFRPPADLEQLPYVAFRFESGKITADTGRYFLVPPALHPSGQVYTFLPGRGPDTPIAEMPLVVYRHLAEQAREEDSEQREQIRVDPGAKIHAGNRRDMIFRFACMQRRWGLSRSEISALAHSFNETRCDPPVDPKLVDVQIDGAMKKQGDQELAHAAAPDEPTAEPVEGADSWTPVDLNTLPETPPIQPTLGDEGLLYPGKRHVFSGPPESAKTLAAYALGIRIVRAGGILIIIDFEMGSYDARSRLRELGATTDDISRIRYLEPDEPATDDRVSRLVQLAPRLVLIDAAAGAYDLQGLDDNKRGDVEKLARLYVRSFWRKGIATLMLDHVVKNAETRGKFVIGSERKLGAVDVHLGFETITPISRGTTGHYKILTRKDRGGWLQRGKLADFELSSDPATHVIRWAFKPTGHEESDKPQLPTILMERASKTLEEAAEPLSQNQIVRNTKGSDSWLPKAIDHLVDLGHVQESEGLNRARLFTSLTAFRKDEYDKQYQFRQVPPDSAQVPPAEPRHVPPSSAPPYRGRDTGDGGTDPPGSAIQTDLWLDDLAATVDLEQEAGTIDESEAA